MFSSCHVQIARLILIGGVWEADGAFFKKMFLPIGRENRPLLYVIIKP